MRKLSKKILAVLIIISMIAAVFPMSTIAFAANESHTHSLCGATCTHDSAHDDVEFSPFPANFNGGSLSGNYYLDRDIDLSESITLSVSLTLCLNGNVLRATNDQRVITFTSSGAVLNLCDCGDKVHRFSNLIDGWRLNETYGNETVSGGVITGGSSCSGPFVQDGGAIFVTHGSTFNMFGGNIVGNSATLNGGAVCFKSATFNMYGGRITGNYASNYGGGVYLSYGCSVTLSGGVIKNNGAPNFDNHITQSNIYLDGIKINLGNITEGSSFGVSLPEHPNTNVEFTNSCTTNYKRYFTSDQDYYVLYSSSNTLTIKEILEHGHCVMCGSSYNYVYESCDENHDIVEFSSFSSYNGGGSNYSYYYYLETDTQLARTINVSSGETVYLCLNGNNLVAPENNPAFSVSGTLIVCDCKNYSTNYFTPTEDGLWQRSTSNTGKAVKGGAIVSYESYWRGESNSGSSSSGSYGSSSYSQDSYSAVQVDNGGSFILNSGNIIGNRSTYKGGGAVLVNNGSFTMNGGTIAGNVAGKSDSDYHFNGGAVHLERATFTMNGGTIDENSIVASTTLYSVVNGGGVYVDDYSVFTMNGGTIKNNKSFLNAGSSFGEGGGVYVKGTFNMNGGSITGNQGGHGGGVYVRGTFNMNGGSITGNQGDRGGGVYIYGNMTLTGSPVIKDNQSYNVYLLNSNNGMTIGDGGLAEGAHIGVMARDQIIVNANSTDYSKYFVPDTNNINFVYETDGTIVAKTYVNHLLNAKYSISLNLARSIDVKLSIKNVDITPEIFSKIQLLINDSPVSLTHLTDEATGRGYATAIIASKEAKEIADNINIKVIYDGRTVKEKTYSVLDYCNAVFEQYSGTKIADLCYALINYGKCDAEYAGEDSTKITTGLDLTAMQGVVDNYSLGLAPIAAQEVVAGEAFSNIAASLSIDSTTTMNFKITSSENLENKTFSVKNNDNVPVDPELFALNKSGNEYTLSVNNIAANTLSRRYTVTIDGIDESDFKIVFGPYNYLEELNNLSTSSAELKALANAIYVYGQVAAEIVEAQ